MANANCFSDSPTTWSHVLCVIRERPILGTLKIILELLLLSNGITAFYFVLLQTCAWMRDPNRTPTTKPGTIQSAIINSTILGYDIYLHKFWTSKGGRGPLRVSHYTFSPDNVELFIIAVIFLSIAPLGTAWIWFTFFIWNSVGLTAVALTSLMSFALWTLLPRPKGCQMI